MALGWLKTGTGLALIVIAAFVMIHPDADLLGGLFHPRQDAHQELAFAITVQWDEPLVVAATAPLDTTPVVAVYRPDSLDQQCVRLC